ncbi:hypothetical protein ACFL11_00865 [Patescibacteria group bacterium]
MEVKIMKHKFIFRLTTIFWALVGVFTVIVSNIILMPLIPQVLRGYMIFLMFTSWTFFFALGLALIVLTLKKKVEGSLKKFLLLTGASAVGFPVFVILHNVVDGLLNVEEPFFFLLAVIVCPLGFLVGAIGAIVLFRKKGKGQ